MNKSLLLAVLLSNLLAISAHAASATNNIQSNAALESQCVISSENMSFGNLNLLNSTVVFATANLTVKCSKSISYNVVPTGGFNNSRGQIMKGTGENTDGLSVSLVRKPSGSWVIWENTNNNKVTGTGTGQNVIHEIGAGFSSAWDAKMNHSALTNIYNYQAAPDNYSGTVAILITY